MNTEQAEYMRRDTEYVLNHQYTRDTLLVGVGFLESPIFDTLAADRFASDRYNLGDYR